MKHFLIVYHRKRGQILLGPDEYAEADSHAALRRRIALEEQYLTDPEVEVVVLSGASLDHLKFSHGRYFKTIAELAS